MKGGVGEIGRTAGPKFTRSGGAGYRWTSAIDRIYMINKVVARASGTDLASSSKQNKIWMRGCVSVSVSMSVSVSVSARCLEAFSGF